MPTNWGRILVLALLPTLCGASEGPTSSVTILVLDVYGSAIPVRVEKFTPKEGWPEMASHFDGLKAAEIPFGDYKLSLSRIPSAGAFDKISANVTVEVPDQTIVVVAERYYSAMSEDFGPYSVTKFRIEPVLADGETGDPLRVRLSGLVRDDQKVAVVDRSGEFRIDGWLYGPYVMTVIRGTQVIAVQTIVFHGMQRAETVVVRLPSEAPAVLHVYPHPQR